METMEKSQESEEILRKLKEESRELREKLGEKEQELSLLARMHKLRKKEASALIRELESELSSLNLELDSMCTDKRASEEQVENKEQQTHVSNLEKIAREMDKELSALVNGVEDIEDDSVSEVSKIKGLMTQVNNLKLNVDCLHAQKGDPEEQRARESSDFVSQIENLKKELAINIVDLQKMEKEKEISVARASDLEEKINQKDQENNQLRQEMEGLREKAVQIEKTLKEREDQFFALQKKLETGDGFESKNEVERHIERLNQLENENNELNSKISDQEVILKQQEDAINKLREDSKLVKSRFLQAADRKMDELSGEFRKNFEDKLRILSQRIRVAEQLHTENKDNIKRIQERCEQQHPGLERKLNDLMSSREADVWKISEGVDEMIKGMELVIRNCECKESSLLNQLSRISDEIQVVKNWVRWTMDEIKPWKNEMGNSPFAIDEKEQDKVMKENVRRLEAKVNKEKGDKLRLMRGVYELQKKVAELEKVVIEKDEGLLRLGNEKVEAIRQLCMWIDYHQSRFDHFKEMFLIKKTKSRGRS